MFDFDWVPLISEWSFHGQALVLSIVIPVLLLPVLGVLYTLVAMYSGVPREYSANKHRPRSLPRIMFGYTIGGALQVMLLVTALISVTLHVLWVVYGIILPASDWPFYTESLAIAFGMFWLVVYGIVVCGFEHDIELFSGLLGPVYILLAPLMIALTLIVALACFVFIGAFLITGSMILFSIDFQPTDMTFIIFLICAVFFAILLALFTGGYP